MNATQIDFQNIHHFAINNVKQERVILNIISNDGDMSPSDFMLSLPISCLSAKIYITLILHGLNPQMNVWVLLSHKKHLAFFPIYFHDDPVDQKTNMLKTSAIFDDVDEVDLVCQAITPYEEDIDIIGLQPIIDMPILDPHEHLVLPCVPHRNYLIPDVPGCTIRGLLNNEDEYLLVQDILEGSLDESCNKENDEDTHCDWL